MNLRREFYTAAILMFLVWKNDSEELRSTDNKHCWILKKFDKEGFPGLALYHSHDGDVHHVHFYFKTVEVVPVLSEITER